MLFEPQAPSSLLAVMTTVHLALAALRNYRAPTTLPISSLAIVSLSLAGLPWIFPSLWGIALGLAVHAIWFAVCERLVPARAAQPSPRLPSSSASTSIPARSSPSHASAPSPRGFVQAPVLAVLDETRTIRTIRIARPEGFRFEAGQFMPVRMRVDGKELTRCYSISSPPSTAGYLEISVKRQGVVSNALHAAVRPGSLLSIRQPAGSFKYPGDDDRPLVLIAGGVGITPLMSMLRHAVVTQPTRPVTLAYGAHTEDDFAFRDELEMLARRHPQVRVQLAASRASTAGHVYPGRVDGTLLSAIAPDLQHSIVMLCGPAAMIDSLKGSLGEASVPAAQIRHEVFEAAIAASADAPPRAAPASDRTFQVSCTESRRDIHIQQGQTLLEAAEESGVSIPSLCRAGVCGTCRVQVTDGRVDCESTTLAPGETEEGFVLACVTTVQSDCAVRV